MAHFTAVAFTVMASWLVLGGPAHALSIKITYLLVE